MSEKTANLYVYHNSVTSPYQEHEAELDRQFSLLDLNNDATLNREELATCFRRLGLEKTYGSSFRE